MHHFRIIMSSKSLTELIKTSKDRRALAKAMLAPLQKRMDYSSIGRRAFIVQFECDVCHEFLARVRLYENDFTISGKDIEKCKENDDTYRVCKKCVKATAKKLSLLDELSLDQIPLYINDENVFVQKRAVERLKKGQ